MQTSKGNDVTCFEIEVSTFGRHSSLLCVAMKILAFLIFIRIHPMAQYSQNNNLQQNKFFFHIADNEPVAFHNMAL